MEIIVVIAVLILIGAYFMLRDRPAAEPARDPVARAEALELRDHVAARLRDRLAGWSVETDEEEPLTLIVREDATERRLYLKLGDLADRWRTVRQRDPEEAEALLESFVAGATGENEEAASELDLQWVTTALALELMAPEKVPSHALSRPVGPLAAGLVLRNPAGPDRISSEDLRAWSLSEEQAFSMALQNLTHDVEEGVSFEPVVTPDGARGFHVAFGEPLAASYALVPQLREQLAERFGDRPFVYWIRARQTLLAAEEGAQPERLEPGVTETPLVPTPLSPDSLRLP